MKAKYFSVILIIFIAFILFKILNVGHNPQEIFMKDLKVMITDKDVDKIEVVNKYEARIYLKSDRLTKYSKLIHLGIFNFKNKGPQFKLQIGDMMTFKEDVDNFQKDFSPGDFVYISYKEENDYSYDIGILSIIILPFIIWLLFLIDILKSEFKNSIDKLIWLIIITLIPVIGLILYFFIGKKQKIIKES